jgi:hypothetical protein
MWYIYEAAGSLIIVATRLEPSGCIFFSILLSLGSSRVTVIMRRLAAVHRAAAIAFI